MFTMCYSLFFTIFVPPHHFTQYGGEEKYNICNSLKIWIYFSKILLIDDLLLLTIMGKTKHNISKLEKNKKYKLQTVLDIIMITLMLRVQVMRILKMILLSRAIQVIQNTAVKVMK